MELIFIIDGVVWIRNWISDAYRHATQILDWFHAGEHLCEFAKEYFSDEEQKRQWIKNDVESNRLKIAFLFHHKIDNTFDFNCRIKILNE